MTTLIAIISIVAAVLQIVLFFKLWGMTNDVKRIAKKFGCYNEPKDEAMMALLMKDKDKAIEILSKAMAQDVVEFVKGDHSRYASITTINEIYRERFEKLGVTDIPVKQYDMEKDVKSLID